jgi:hypothetical protein
MQLLGEKGLQALDGFASPAPEVIHTHGGSAAAVPGFGGEDAEAGDFGRDIRDALAAVLASRGFLTMVALVWV